MRSSTESSDATHAQSAHERRQQARPPAARASSQRLQRPARAAPAAAGRSRRRGGRAGGAARRARPPRGPGAALSTATRSDRNSASSTSWVTRTTVRGSAARASASHCCISARVIASSDGERLVEQQHRPAGQQRAHERHALAHAARTARRGRARSKSASPKRSNSGAARSRASRRRDALALERQRGVAERVAPGQQQVALGHVGARVAPVARGPATAIVPASGSCRPATSSSSVDLPQPEGPTTPSTSPAPTSRSSPPSAGHGAEAAGDAPRSPRCVLRMARGSSAGASTFVASLPPRALPHRFEGSAPGDDAGALSQPACPRAPLLSFRTVSLWSAAVAADRMRLKFRLAHAQSLLTTVEEVPPQRPATLAPMECFPTQ